MAHADEVLSKAGVLRADWPQPLSHAAPPTLDGVLYDRDIGLSRPRLRERRGGALWALSLRWRRKAYPHRHRHAFADRNRFAVTQCREKVHQAVGGLRDGTAHDFLILLPGHTESKHRVALRQQPRCQIRRSLTDHAQRDPVFTALLGDAE